ncbi:MAG: type II toxin-antitoxin system VapC family toxin [Candidatus Jordarchaeum sp.]|uniref:type II toxin-antitoxin system VapC family toxin n=1 Tax=Candidatus Jordarchaeum sp. TaxID=2823881 RepID=UPI004049B12F
MILVADSSFLFSLMEGNSEVTQIWGKAKTEGNRIYIPTISITFFVKKCYREGKSEYIDLILAVLKQTLNVTMVVCDIGVSIDAGRLLETVGADIEEAFILAIASLKNAKGVMTINKGKYLSAVKKGLIKTVL